jgi:hypothetical protein
MTRRGKIARLPHPIREQINQRLQNGEEAKQIAAWLNTLPDVTSLMAAEFDGQPVSEVNLSNWKLGGYRDWEDQQAAFDSALLFHSEAAQLSQAGGGPQLADHLALCLTARLAAALRHTSANADDPAQALEELRRLRRDLVALRKGDHNAQWVKIQREKLELDLKKFEHQAAIQNSKMEPKVRGPRPEAGITKETIAQLEKALNLF